MTREAIYQYYRDAEIDVITAMTVADVLSGEDDNKTMAWMDMSSGDTFTNAAERNGIDRRSFMRFRKKIEKKAKGITEV